MMVTISKQAQLSFIQGQIAEENRILQHLYKQQKHLEERIKKAVELHHCYYAAAKALEAQIELERVCY